MKTVTTENIMSLKKNQKVLRKYFAGVVSERYCDGTSHQLYLDLQNGSIFEHQEVTPHEGIYRDDGSLVQLEQIHHPASKVKMDPMYPRHAGFDENLNAFIGKIKTAIEEMFFDQEYNKKQEQLEQYLEELATNGWDRV